MGGLQTSAEGATLYLRVWVLPQKILKSRGSEMVYLAFSMSYFFLFFFFKHTLDKCKMPGTFCCYSNSLTVWLVYVLKLDWKRLSLEEAHVWGMCSLTSWSLSLPWYILALVYWRGILHSQCVGRKRIRKQKISKRFGTRLKLCKFTSPNETSEIQAPVSSGEYSVYFTSVPK